MLKTYKFRLYPNKSQKTLLQNHLNNCRWLYNYLLNLKRNTYKTDKISLSSYDLQKLLPIIKTRYASLKDIHSQVLQDIPKRIDLAFSAFFRRLKNNEDPGYPRFKGYNRYDSFTYKQSGFQFQKNRLQLSKIGKIKIRQHRPINGEIKTLTIWKNRLNQWFVCVVVNVPNNILPKTHKKVGLDLGIEKFATLSNNTTIENPKYLNKKLKALQKQSKRYSVAKNKEDKKKQKYRLAKLHLKIKNTRNDFLHKTSKQLIQENNIIVVENLDIQNMQKDNYKVLNRYIGDVGWNIFINMLFYKAEDAGRILIKINPKNTSKTCHNCGYINTNLKLNDRIYDCPQCNIKINRDYNASLNILGLGLQSLNIDSKAVNVLEAPVL